MLLKRPDEININIVCDQYTLDYFSKCEFRVKDAKKGIIEVIHPEEKLQLEIIAIAKHNKKIRRKINNLINKRFKEGNNNVYKDFGREVLELLKWITKKH